MHAFKCLHHFESLSICVILWINKIVKLMHLHTKLICAVIHKNTAMIPKVISLQFVHAFIFAMSKNVLCYHYL